MSYLDWKDKNEKDYVDMQLEDHILPCFEGTRENEILNRRIEMSVRDSVKKFTDIHPTALMNVFAEYLYERYQIEDADAEYLSELMRSGCDHSKNEGIDFVLGAIIDSGIDFDWVNFLAAVNKKEFSAEIIPNNATACSRVTNTKLGIYVFRYVFVQSVPDWVILSIRYNNHITGASAVATRRVKYSDTNGIRYELLRLASLIAMELNKDADDINTINELAVKAFSEMGLNLNERK